MKIIKPRIIELKPVENLITINRENEQPSRNNEQKLKGSLSKSLSSSSLSNKSDSDEQAPAKPTPLQPEIIKLIFEDMINDRDTLEDGNLTKSWFVKQNIAELGCGIFNLIGLGLGFIAYDVENDLQSIYDSNLTTTISFNQSDSLKNYLYWMLLISTLCLCLLVFVRYYVKLRWYQTKKILPRDWRLLPSSILRGLILELILVIVIPNPFMMETNFKVNNSITNTIVTYKLNDILVLLMLLRIIIIIRIFLANTPYYTNSSFRVCRMHGCEPGYFYVMKCLMKKAPQQVIWMSMGMVIVVFGYAIKVIERPLIHALITNDPTNTSNDLSSYLNAVWCMIVTLTTVGYGDFYPRTIPGRAIIFVICIFGATSVSMMVFSLQTVLALSNAENRAQNVIDRLIVRKNMRKEAAIIITFLARIRHYSKKIMKISKDTITSTTVQMKVHMIRFRNLRVKLRSLQDNTSIQDEISRYFLFLKDDFVVLEERIDFLANFHEMIRRYLQEKDLIKKEQSHNHLKPTKSLIPDSITKKEIKNFRKRISMIKIDEKKLNLTPSLKNLADNSSLLSNYLRKQRLQEYQTNTKFYQDNPLKSNKRKMSHIDAGLLEPGSGVIKNLERIHEDDLEHNNIVEDVEGLTKKET